MIRLGIWKSMPAIFHNDEPIVLWLRSAGGWSKAIQAMKEILREMQ